MNKTKKKLYFHSYGDRREYILTICLYCWWLWISLWSSRIRKGIDNGLSCIIRWFVINFLPQNYMDKLNRNLEYNKPFLDTFFRDLECGDDIITAKNIVHSTCIGYVVFPVSIITCGVCSVIGWNNIFRWKDGICALILPLILVLQVWIGVSIILKNSQNPSIYLPYFKKFENQDESWLKKWKIFTLILFAGCIVSVMLSIGFFFLCLMIERHNQEFI